LKSKSLWLKEGDSNTSFFHKQAQNQRKQNKTTSILSNTGQQLDSFEQVKEVAFHHFEFLYQQPSNEGMNEEVLDMLANIPSVVFEHENNQLVREITEEAPGPNGFPIRFYRSFWATIKRDLKKMLNYTLQKQKLGGATNSTFLALIPKDSNPANFSRFHPISLCNFAYKIPTKIIANHLKPLLSILIPKNQGGFLKNKHITDNIVLVQEAIHSSKKCKVPGMVIKLDMVNGFYEVFVCWIRACIGSPWISPLINGLDLRNFQGHDAPFPPSFTSY